MELSPGPPNDLESDFASQRKKRQVADAVAASLIPSAKRRKEHDDRVRAQLQASGRVLHEVPADGDCLFSAVLLGCDSIGIREHEDASCLAVLWPIGFARMRSSYLISAAGTIRGVA